MWGLRTHGLKKKPLASKKATIQDVLFISDKKSDVIPLWHSSMRREVWSPRRSLCDWLPRGFQSSLTPIPRQGVDGFLFHFSFAPRLIQLHRSYVLFLIKAYASRRRRSSPLQGGRWRVHTRWVLMIFQWGERVPSFS